MEKFSIILVDDEELAIRGIESGVDWARLNIEKVYKAHNKDTAIRMLSMYSIDIVLTDIEMPNGNGLELIHWVKENKKEIVSIFYTGHADFAYAQEAIRLGVHDYLLKPIPYDKLENIILHAILLVKERAQTSENNKVFHEVWDGFSKEEGANVVENLKKFIIENIDKEIPRDALAAAVHVSPNYLSRLFKKQEGISLSEYILKKRIAVAKQLLIKTDLPVTVIAGRVGISFASYFTKVFKEQENITPQKYREIARREH